MEAQAAQVSQLSLSTTIGMSEAKILLLEYCQIVS